MTTYKVRIINRTGMPLTPGDIVVRDGTQQFAIAQELIQPNATGRGISHAEAADPIDCVRASLREHARALKIFRCGDGAQ